MPVWMEIARQYLGLREYDEKRPGPNGELSHPKIEEWQALAGIRRPDDTIPWCSAFVTGIMHEAGLTDFRTSAARAWRQWGRPLTEPRTGCVVVLWRDGPTSPHGHVGLYERTDGTGALWLLGGNQGNAVTIKPYARARLIGFRWPTAAQLERAGLDGDGVRRPS